MAKVQIIGTRGTLECTVQTLHRAGVLQIKEKPPSVEAMRLDESATRQHSAPRFNRCVCTMSNFSASFLRVAVKNSRRFGGEALFC